MPSSSVAAVAEHQTDDDAQQQSDRHASTSDVPWMVARVAIRRTRSTPEPAAGLAFGALELCLDRAQMRFELAARVAEVVVDLGPALCEQRLGFRDELAQIFDQLLG